MKSVLHNLLRTYAVWIVLFLLCLIIQWLELRQLLRFDRDLIVQGNVWLLISGHLVHLNWNHFILNMAGILLVVLFFNRYCSQRRWLIFILFSSAFTGLGLFWLNPELTWYVGMSGVLHGLFVMGAWYESRNYALSGWLLLSLIVAKLLYEQMAGAMPGSESMTGGKVAVDAHLYGGLSGGLFVVLSYLLHQLIHVDDRHQNRHHDGQHDHTHHDNQ
ncbi:MAG: rhombosortase [Gammaproteobacteria bacterium]|nr:rhombosortase [Gammaproteobacteria bacterium]